LFEDLQSALAKPAWTRLKNLEKKRLSFSGVFLKNVRKPSLSFFSRGKKAAAPTTTNDYELKTNPLPTLETIPFDPTAFTNST
jgi:hypothetical protein